jgi:ribosomal protein S1
MHSCPYPRLICGPSATWINSSGKKFEFKILKCNRKGSNIVLSRRAILEKETDEKRSKILASFHKGKIVMALSLLLQLTES